ncbi:MAG: hypothetical protein CVT65_05980 [Actinobacteria bacterium HGW-Actinobacteria-5]|jgi:hypothetical protein|nr:MAG: hypothetical protein CVT65_05980 [Actinobacteria bacterium HGW-Actinobacteria-5]
MTGVHGSWMVPRRVLLLCVVATILLLAPLTGAYLLAGVPAAVGMVMGYVAGARPALTLRPYQAVVLAVPAAMTGAVAVALRGQPMAAACFVALCCILVAPASIRADGLMAGVPSIAAVLVSVPGDFRSDAVAFWMLLGGAVMALLGSWIGTSGRTGKGIAPERAWRHAVVMAVAVGLTVYAVDVLAWPHGYWVALTLTVVLRPFGEETLQRSWQRVLGTIGGVVLAMVLAALLPLWAAGVALGLCLVLSLAYTTLGDYPKQVLFLTPSVVLLGSASPGALATERALYTVTGAVLAGGIALALAWYDSRRTKKELV